MTSPTTPNPLAPKSPPQSSRSSFSPFNSTPLIFTLALALRAILFLYGLHQDATSPMKYTDIDYFVFTDSSRFLAQGESPYARDTYRYTPLLAWLLYPTTWGGLWFHFGKVLFAAGDVVTGWMMVRILTAYGTPAGCNEISTGNAKREQKERDINKAPSSKPGVGNGMAMDTPMALKFASIWLLNPMVSTISTRGSSEGLLGAIVIALLWAALSRNIILTGILLGFAVHLKIYPFIYAASVVWWMGSGCTKESRAKSPVQQALAFVTKERLVLGISALTTFAALNAGMYALYGHDFLEHSFLYHLRRIDHRHNFSVYNTLLYLNSSPHRETLAHTVNSFQSPDSGFQLERLAFIPQLLLSVVLIPVVLAKKDLPGCMLAQTFAFVAFNKVCTSQYFLWYMMFLPFYLPCSTLLASKRAGITALVAWVVGQVAWLQQGYQLEFLGNSTFVPGLWASGILFFVVNVGILGVIISDVKAYS